MTEEEEKEFDKYIRNAVYQKWTSSAPFGDYIKSFISALLKKREERVLDIVEGMNKFVGLKGAWENGWHKRSYNRALSDLRERIINNR